MKLEEFIPIFLEVIKDWRVIVTIVAMFFVVSVAKYVITYRKKPRKQKASKKKNIQQNETPKKATEETEESYEE